MQMDYNSIQPCYTFVSNLIFMYDMQDMNMIEQYCETQAKVKVKGIQGMVSSIERGAN